MSTPTTDSRQTEDRRSDVSLGARLKVCGITEPAEVDVLGAQSVDFVGLWYGVPGGPADLPVDRWRQLAGATSSQRLAPVLVTFSKDVELLREAIEGTEVHWVQLHGYQTPGFVKSVKRVIPEARVIKVLHVRGSDCVESSLIGSYERAGTDVFLLDAVAEDGRVGSTGQTLDPEVALSLAGQLARPFLLAGGISAENRDKYAAIVSHPLYLGIDVDTNARGADHKVNAERVRAIAQAWKESNA